MFRLGPDLARKGGRHNLNCCTCTQVVGILPYYIPGLSGVFCGTACTNTAYEHFRAQIRKTEAGTRKVKVNVMQQKAEDFGGAEVYRHYCDNLKCKRPIILCWKSREGEFCSNKCMKEVQASPSEETKTNTIEENMSNKKEAMKSKSSPKAAATKPAAVKTTKPAVKPAPKAAPAPKVKAEKAPATSANKSRPGLDDKAVIHVVSIDHKYKGMSADRFKLLANGMTVDDFVNSNKKNLDNKRCGYAYIADFLTSAKKSGYITIGGGAKA